MIAAVRIGSVAAMVVWPPGGAIFEDNVVCRSDPAAIGLAQFSGTERGKSALSIEPHGNSSEVLIADLPLKRGGGGIIAGQSVIHFGAYPNGRSICLSRVKTDGFGFGGGVIVQCMRVEFGRAVADRPGRKKFVGVVTGVDGQPDSDLLKIIEALCAFCPFFCACQSGQQHRGENSDDGDDDQ